MNKLTNTFTIIIIPERIKRKLQPIYLSFNNLFDSRFRWKIRMASKYR